jgi:hypothetical protein
MKFARSDYNQGCSDTTFRPRNNPEAIRLMGDFAELTHALTTVFASARQTGAHSSPSGFPPARAFRRDYDVAKKALT